MKKKTLHRDLLLVGLVLIIVGGLLIPLLANDDLLRQTVFQLKTGQETIIELRNAVLAYGGWAPVLFIGIQILQVLLAPIPGELSGFLGGYLFGAWPGFLYSSIGLTIGSWIAFGIGRIIWDLMPERVIETKLFQRFNTLVCKGQFILPFILFLLPGLPKDSLSYLLGISRMPLPVFLFITGIGRMPGTLMLSYQGADVFTAHYFRLFILLTISVILALPCFYYRRNMLAAFLKYSRRKKRAGLNSTQANHRTLP